MMAVGDKLGTVPRVPGMSGVMTSVQRCQESAGHIRGSWKVAEKWGILSQLHTEIRCDIMYLTVILEG